MCMPALFRRTHFKETGASSYGLQPLLQYHGIKQSEQGFFALQSMFIQI